MRFLSLPHHASKEGLYLNAEQNVKGMFLKYIFSLMLMLLLGLFIRKRKSRTRSMQSCIMTKPFAITQLAMTE